MYKLSLIILLSFFIFIECNLNSSSKVITEYKPFTSKEITDTLITEAKTIKHKFNNRGVNWERTIILPITGKFAEESHYVTKADSFNKVWPIDSIENIEKHLLQSLETYKRFDSTITFESLYNNYWHKEWTPAEGGHIGQGSIGDIQLQMLTPETELWLLTMMWAPGEKPKAGTKFILSANEKSVVVVAGFETGPADKKFMGGITREVHAWLETNSESEIKLEYLKNQQMPEGPTIN